MRKLILAAVLGLAFSTPALSQTVVPAVLTWTNPITATDGSPLTGPNALVKIQVFWSTAPLKVGTTDPILQPNIELQAVNGVVPTTYTFPSIASGTTQYFRIKACNAGVCSNYSGEVNKSNAVKFNKPNTPTAVTVAKNSTDNPNSQISLNIQ